MEKQCFYKEISGGVFVVRCFALIKRYMAKVFAVCLSLIIVSPFLCLKADALSCRAFALIDANSGRVIMSSNADIRLPMASTTKIMTGFLAVESGKLDEEFTVSADAIKIEGSSMGLKANEKITLRELTYGLMLESGNDAANVIACCVAGSIGDFVNLMNDKAEELGLHDTHFCNPSGLSNEDHYTTAKDLAELTCVAMQNPEFEKIVSTQKIRVSYDGIKNGRYLSNHNKLLSSYEGAIGVKTGFTKKSGRCLVSCAERNGVKLIVTTLNCPDDWQDHTELLDEGFQLLKNSQILSTHNNMTVNVVGGKSDSVEVANEKLVTASLKNGEFSKVEECVELDSFYYAPIKKDQILGKMVYKVDSTVVATTDIKALNDVELNKKSDVTNWFTDFINNIGEFFKNLFN